MGGQYNFGGIPQGLIRSLGRGFLVVVNNLTKS
jgi:hypothetical protein